MVTVVRSCIVVSLDLRDVHNIVKLDEAVYVFTDTKNFSIRSGMMGYFSTSVRFLFCDFLLRTKYLFSIFGA